jgi:hypothetical protein
MDPKTETPYETIVQCPISHRISLDTVANLDLIKHVVFKWHRDLSDITMTMNKNNNILDVESLYMSATILDRSRTCVQCPYWSSSAPTARGLCLLVRMHRPQKLVIGGAHTNCADHDVAVFERLQTIVYIMGASSPGYEHPTSGSPFPCSTAGVQRIIQIFGPDSRETFSKTPRHITLTPQGQWVEPIAAYVSQYALGVQRLITHHDHIVEFVVVNGCEVHHLARDPPKHSVHQEKEAKFEALVFQALSKVVKFKVTQRPGHIDIKYNNRNINVKFIGLETYLNTYDWSGEFTAEEVSEWLENQEEE